MSLAYAGGDPNQMAQIAYKVQTSWPDVAMTILHDYGLWGMAVCTIMITIVYLIFRGRK